MLSEPKIVERPAQPYAAIKAFVTMAEIPEVLPGLHPQLAGWLAQHGGAPTGPPFFKYNVVNMDGQMEIEVGFPVANAYDGDDVVTTDELPAGRYATIVHTGHPAGLMGATRVLLEWAHLRDLRWAITPGPHGGRWTARLENYLDGDNPDMDKWGTELAFLLAED